MTADFVLDVPETRRSLELMKKALDTFTRVEMTPILLDRGVYEFPYCSSRVAETAKAARIVSTLDAALVLLSARKSTEATALIRLVSDYCAEIDFLYEGAAPSSERAAHRRFLEDFFQGTPRNIAEWRARQSAGSAGYVSRKEINKALERLAQQVPSLDSAAVRDLTETHRALEAAKNGYVHGGYYEAMEAFNPTAREFEVFGVTNAAVLAASVKFLVVNVHPALVSFSYMAIERGLNLLANEINEQRRRLETAPEYTLPPNDE